MRCWTPRSRCSSRSADRECACSWWIQHRVARLGRIVTPDNDLVSTDAARADVSVRAKAPRRGAATPRRRTTATILAGLAVVGFSAAIVAPAGIAMATPSADEPAAAQSVYSLAAKDAQTFDITVQGAQGVQATPIAREGFEVYVTPTPTPTPTPEPASDPGSGSSEESGESSGGGGGGGPMYYTGGGDPAAWMAAAGIAPEDWGYVDYIVSRESGWNPNAVNSSSGASGLVQALPCDKVPGSCFDPVDNLRWADGYAKSRYGSWAEAVGFWSANHWW